MVDGFTYSEKEIEKKERLAQTYIVIFGLLITSESVFPESLVIIFFFFLVSIIPYYTILTNIKTQIKIKASNMPRSINRLAILSSFLFGVALYIYTYPVVDYMVGNHIFFPLPPIHTSFLMEMAFLGYNGLLTLVVYIH